MITRENIRAAVLAAIDGYAHNRTRGVLSNQFEIDDQDAFVEAIVELVATAPTLAAQPTLNIHPGPNPGSVARSIRRSLDEQSLPSGPTLPSGVSGNGRDSKVTERDRFLDDANDRRTALSAAARLMAATPERANAGIVGVTQVSREFLQHLREGKPTA